MADDNGTNLVTGIVHNSVDPEGMGRVQIVFPGRSDGGPVWAQVASEGDPAKGDVVVVGFLEGDAAYPVVLGILRLSPD